MGLGTMIFDNRAKRRADDFSREGRHRNNNATRDARGRFLHPVTGVAMTAKEHGAMLRMIQEEKELEKQGVHKHKGPVINT
jgi:hypothetical protein